MDHYLLAKIAADHRRDLLNQAASSRLAADLHRTRRPAVARRRYRWHIQSPVVRRPTPHALCR